MKRLTLTFLVVILFFVASCNLPIGKTSPTPTPEVYPTLTPVPSVVIVALDGSGNFTTLDEAVKKVKPGATIYLSSGTHTLTEGIRIEKEITLIGGGMSETILTSPVAPVMSIQLLSGNVTLSGISFQYTGSTPGSVVYISSQERVEITDCEFTGGKDDIDPGTAGVGLSLRAKSGVIRDSRFNNNQNDGLELFGVSTLGIENSTFNGNGQTGLNVGAGYSGMVTGSEFSNNTGSGISVVDPSTPIIQNNRISGNQESGIVYWYGASGSAIENQISANGMDGISVQEASSPTLSGNMITDNSQAGIYFGNGAKGHAEKNECTGNKWGMYLDTAASPSIGDNNLHNNTYLDVEDRR